MDQSQICCDRLPSLSRQHVWLVAQMLESEDKIGDQVFYTINDWLPRYRCRVPELLGRRIRGCFHGWVILSNHPQNIVWFLWNPSTSKLTGLPLLNNGDGDISECCLSSPPGDAGSVVLLTRWEKPTFVFCRLDGKRKRMRWTEMSYAEQLKRITAEDGFVECLTCCNGKIYALTTGGDCDDMFVIEVDIVVNFKEVVINLLPFVKLPDYNDYEPYRFKYPSLRGTCSGLVVVYQYCKQYTLYSVRLVKLDMTRKLWEEMEDFDDAACFLGLSCSSTVIASELGGGYVHMFYEEDNAIYSCHIKDKIASLSSMLRLDSPTRPRSRTSYVSPWAIPECRFILLFLLNLYLFIIHVKEKIINKTLLIKTIICGVGWKVIMKKLIIGLILNKKITRKKMIDLRLKLIA